MNCILLSAYVGCCINCKNMHGMSNIKFINLFPLVYTWHIRNSIILDNVCGVIYV
jgi:hypothetical protein